MYDVDICLRYCQICWVFLGIPKNLAGSAHASAYGGEASPRYSSPHMSPAGPRPALSCSADRPVWARLKIRVRPAASWW